MMAWIMDTVSMSAGYSVAAVVTGKPLSVGGSKGRNAATGRGTTITGLQACREFGIDPASATVAIQGFGNADSIAGGRRSAFALCDAL
jgi:glutamate dehydrogenase (NAD(P)+)